MSEPLQHGLAKAQASGDNAGGRGFKRRLDKIYGLYTLGFIAFVLGLAVLERAGLSKTGLGLIFLLAPVLLYAFIGIISRTTDPAEYYVAGRRVPAVYNGMAIAADWMSAASFLGLAGSLYLSGYSGLAFVLGWTGGYCLVALLLAPYLRQFGEYTIPDFLGARYAGNLVRGVAIVATLLCSFTYVVAQIYGVGLITTRLTGLTFEIGVFVGLGGVLVCSFLGGMRAVTWTQVAQYIIIIIAYLVPVVWLSVKQTGIPVPQLVYGYQLQKVSAREQELMHDPKELEVMQIFAQRARQFEEKLADVPVALAMDRARASERVAELKRNEAGLARVQAAEKALGALPKNVAEAQDSWAKAKLANEARAKPLAGMQAHARQFDGDPNGDAKAQRAYDISRLNFLALVFCLMVGTAGLPHILMRCYTTPSVREARESVTWSLFFITLLYVTAPALAVMVKFEVFNGLVGARFDQLPIWIAQWSKVDPSLLSVSDVNMDGILQLGEISIGGDIIMLATPEIAGLPYVVSGMVAAGGLAAALSTADGLLLTISSALSHDFYYRMVNPGASASRRVTISKTLLLVVALTAAAVAVQKPADILFLVAAAFSFAGAAFFPALVLGVFWKRANSWGAVSGMVAGLGITCFYLATTNPWLHGLLGLRAPIELWWGIQPISAGVFGVPLGFAVMVVVSLLTPKPSDAEVQLVDRVRMPNRGDYSAP